MKRIFTFAIAATLIVVCLVLGIHCPTLFAAEPLASGIDRANFDKNVRPQDDLFRAVNGSWLAKAKIPADRSTYGAFPSLIEQSEKDLRAIIEACADAKDNPPGSEKQKIGDMYASYMNAARAEQLGIQPIAEMLASIDRIESKDDLVRTFAELQRDGVSGPLACYVNTDAKKSDQYILYLFEGGLGLPDRDYYWDAKLQKKLAAYAAHVAHMLSLAKVPDAKRAAAEVVAFETRLAKAQWSKLENRDSTKTYNRKSRDELLELAPAFDWNLYFTTIGGENPQEVIVGQPSYFTALSGMLDSVPLATWRSLVEMAGNPALCKSAE